MARKPISDETQKNVLTKSRRRCCLCFWLNGEDEAQKGQIAHIDGDNANNAEDNVAFLCFDHHDEFDGTTRLAKGLRPDEVKQWRDMLYQEMEHRFRTVKKRDFELEIVGFKWIGPEGEYTAKFRLKNTGEVSVRSPVVSIRLPERISGEKPPETTVSDFGDYLVESPVVDPWGMYEEHQDIFEPNGRVGIKELGGVNPVLMPGHACTFFGLGLSVEVTPPGSTLTLQYRVDAEDTVPVAKELTATVPKNHEDLIVEEDDG